MAHIPYGYKIENGKAVLDVTKAKQVRLLFEKYVTVYGLEAAAEAIGIQRKHTSLGKMIENKIYMGDSFYPSIVDSELWNKAQEERKRRVEFLGRSNNYFGKDKSNISAFWGLIFCTECGGDYRRYSNNGKDIWKCACQNAKGKHACNNITISERMLETSFIQLIRGIDISELTAKPRKELAVIEEKYDDPFRQAEYVYSQTDIDDFDYQTKKLLTALKQIPTAFNGDFMQRIIKRIEVSNDGAITFIFINDKSCREELDLYE